MILISMFVMKTEKDDEAAKKTAAARCQKSWDKDGASVTCENKPL